TSGCLLALLRVTASRTFGHYLGHVVTHAHAASWPADQNSRDATFTVARGFRSVGSRLRVLRSGWRTAVRHTSTAVRRQSACDLYVTYIRKVVGAAGFEPAAPCAQGKPRRAFEVLISE